MPRQTTDAGSQALTVIYAALAMGVFLFAAVVLFVLDPLEASLDPGLMKIVWCTSARSSTACARGRTRFVTSALLMMVRFCPIRT